MNNQFENIKDLNEVFSDLKSKLTTLENIDEKLENYLKQLLKLQIEVEKLKNRKDEY